MADFLDDLYSRRHAADPVVRRIREVEIAGAAIPGHRRCALRRRCHRPNKVAPHQAS